MANLLTRLVLSREHSHLTWRNGYITRKYYLFIIFQ